MIRALLLVALVATVAAQAPVTPKPANATAAATTAPAAAAKPAATATATPAATAKSAAVPAAAAGAAAAGTAAVATKDAAMPGAAAAEPAMPTSPCGAGEQPSVGFKIPQGMFLRESCFLMSSLQQLHVDLRCLRSLHYEGLRLIAVLVRALLTFTPHLI